MNFLTSMQILITKSMSLDTLSTYFLQAQKNSQLCSLLQITDLMLKMMYSITPPFSSLLEIVISKYPLCSSHFDICIKSTIVNSITRVVQRRHPDISRKPQMLRYSNLVFFPIPHANRNYLKQTPSSNSKN